MRNQLIVIAGLSLGVWSCNNSQSSTNLTTSEIAETKEKIEPNQISKPTSFGDKKEKRIRELFSTKKWQPCKLVHMHSPRSEGRETDRGETKLIRTLPCE